jgi:hypothetical protein
MKKTKMKQFIQKIQLNSIVYSRAYVFYYFSVFNHILLINNA